MTRFAALLPAIAIGCGGATGAADAAPALADCGEPVTAALAGDRFDPPAADAAGYAAVDAAGRAALADSIAAVAAGDDGAARAAAEAAGYAICRRDGAVRWTPVAGGGRAIIALRPAGAAAGWIVGAPHPVFEAGTRQQAVALFEQLPARALIVSGAHRCANPSPSGCDGTTGVCGVAGEPYRSSDAAHAVASAYHAAHLAIAGAFPDARVISLHGMGGAGASISDGTTLPVAADSTVAGLAAALARESGSDRVTVCNDYPGASREVRLCGTTNAQGRAVNGVAEPCGSAATAASGRFVHLEQSPELRADPAVIVAALRSL